MNSKMVMALIWGALPCIALGQDTGAYECSYGDLKRRVEILTEPGVSVPCEVHYYKDTEAPGEKQVLWSAGSEEGFCERKTEEFITKLEGWGWDCGPGTDTAPEPEAVEEAEAEPPVYDDTDVLSPGDPSG